MFKLRKELSFCSLYVCFLMRTYHEFAWKNANYRLCSTHVEAIIREIKRQRKLLEEYIGRQPEFLTALAPIAIHPDAPLIAHRMQWAAANTGVGPMAAVAGGIAQLAVENALAAGAGEAIVDNGGDIYIASPAEVIVGLYAGRSPLAGKLALRIKPERLPLAVCSSSSKMGHSLSFGCCDLATIVARDAFLADATATRACNQVKTEQDIAPTLRLIMSIPGILGVLLIKDEAIGMAGELPELIKQQDAQLNAKITHHKTNNPSR
jgi:ApbE superfamily uncharacterized protein (UPF0280 family)